VSAVMIYKSTLMAEGYCSFFDVKVGLHQGSFAVFKSNEKSCRTINFFNRVNHAINYFNRALTR